MDYFDLTEPFNLAEGLADPLILNERELNNQLDQALWKDVDRRVKGNIKALARQLADPELSDKDTQFKRGQLAALLWVVDMPEQFRSELKHLTERSDQNEEKD